METGADTETRSGGRAVYCVAAAAGNAAGAVAFGGAERALRIWDPRAPVAAETVGVWRRNLHVFLCLRGIWSKQASWKRLDVQPGRSFPSASHEEAFQVVPANPSACVWQEGAGR